MHQRLPHVDRDRARAGHAEVNVDKGVRISTARFDRLWDAVKAAFFATDYRQALRILRIIARFGRPEFEEFLAKDFARYIREVREAECKAPPATRMDSAQLDEFPGEDRDPETILLEDEEHRRYYERERKKINSLIKNGGISVARERLKWMLISRSAPAWKWAEKKLHQIEQEG